jgi:hypothetical protein
MKPLLLIAALIISIPTSSLLADEKNNMKEKTNFMHAATDKKDEINALNELILHLVSIKKYENSVLAENDAEERVNFFEQQGLYLNNVQFENSSVNYKKTHALIITHNLHDVIEANNGYLPVIKKESPTFNGETFHDDRMYLLYTCKCATSETEEDIATTIYHVAAPQGHTWCVVTYRNSARFQAVKVDHFKSENRAIEYAQHFSPRSPLVSLNGKAPHRPMSYQLYSKRLRENNLSEYSYKNLYPKGVRNPSEKIYLPKQK